MRFDYPGNVRQLENICHWLTVMAPSQVVEAKDLPPELLVDSAMAPVPGGEGGSVAEPALMPIAPPQSAAPQPVGGFANDVPATHGPSAPAPWLADLERESRSMLQAGTPEVWD